MGLTCLSCAHLAADVSKFWDLNQCWAVQGVSGQVKERIELAARTGPDPNLRPLLLFPEVRQHDRFAARRKGWPRHLIQQEVALGTLPVCKVLGAS